MTVDISDGILGLEAHHRWNGGFVLNELSAGLPRVKLDRITGLHSLPEVDDESEPRTAAIGEWIYPVYPRGKTVTYEGWLQGVNQKALTALRHSMITAFSERSAQGVMESIPHPTWGTVSWGFLARVMALDIDDEVTHDTMSDKPTIYDRHFVLSLRLSDPRYVLMDGGHSNSFTADTPITVTVPGSAPTDPVFTFLSPPTGDWIHISNTSVPTSNGTADIEFRAYLAAWKYEVDFSVHQVRIYTDVGNPTTWVEGSAGVDGNVTDWWDELIPGMVPGANTIVSTHNGSVSYAGRSW